MAQLKRASADSHLYILGGQSQGTWQISPAGEQWLRTNRYRLPDRGEGVHLDKGTFRRLKAKGYLYIHGIEYERRNPSVQVQSIRESAASGLPMLLQVDEQRQRWTLRLDLAALDEAAWTGLQRSPTSSVTVMGALSPAIPIRQLRYSSLLEVRPQEQSYCLYLQQGERTDRACQIADPTPGLTAGWQGNVFIDSNRLRGIWRRCPPNSTVPFSGVIYWLAQAGHQPDGWPGASRPLCPEQAGWQLWHLTVEDGIAVSWEALREWFRYRSLELVSWRQHLEVISPLSALTDDGWHVLSPGEPLIVRCEPSSRTAGNVHHVHQRFSLALEPLSFNGQSASPTLSPLSSRTDVSGGRSAYFRWPSLSPGAYRLRLVGNVSAEPLLIRVETRTAVLPDWLPALRCIAALGDVQQTFQAFSGTPEAVQHGQMPALTMFAPDAMPALTWTLEPAGLPVRVSWEYCFPQGEWQADPSGCSICSGEDLTRLWQERIWPALARATQARLVLDASSAGRIELQLTPSLPPPIESAPAINEQLRAQLIWLSRVAGMNNIPARTTLPTPFRAALDQLRMLAGGDAVLSAALERLAALDNAPCWVLTRLRILMQTNSHNSRKNSELLQTVARL